MSIPVIENLPDRLRAIRAALGGDKPITQVELADRLGVSRGSVERWEQGVSKPKTAIVVRSVLALEKKALKQK